MKLSKECFTSKTKRRKVYFKHKSTVKKLKNFNNKFQYSTGYEITMESTNI